MTTKIETIILRVKGPAECNKTTICVTATSNFTRNVTLTMPSGDGQSQTTKDFECVKGWCKNAAWWIQSQLGYFAPNDLGVLTMQLETLK